MGKPVYVWTDEIFADYIKKQKNKVRQRHGISLSTPDLSKILIKKAIEPKQIDISKLIHIDEINIKWRKLKLKL